MPAAGIEVTVALVRGLLEAQHPDLADRPLRVVANGWDNVVLRLGDDLALRVPRRALAAELARHEQERLPVLRRTSPSRSPSRAHGDGGSERRRARAGVPVGVERRALVPGRAVGEVPAGERGDLVDPLAARDEGMRERVRGGGVPHAGALRTLWRRLLLTPEWDGPGVWVRVHGDLHPANLLAVRATDGTCDLSAVIDFGDVLRRRPAPTRDRRARDRGGSFRRLNALDVRASWWSAVNQPGHWCVEEGGGVMSEGPDDVLERLHDAHAEALWRFCLRLTGYDRGRAEDVVQETLLRAWRAAPTLERSEGSLRAWLFTVARNIVIDDWRARQVRGEISVADVPDAGESDRTDQLLTSWMVADALSQLSDEHRAVLVECYFRGTSVAEAAARLGVPPGTVKSRTHYALRALRLALEERGVTA